MERKLIPFPQRLRPRRHRDELEFLPAALEIVETPVSRAGRIMMGAIGVLIVVAVTWACIGKLDIIATANGRIIPSGRTKLIQPLEIGVVKKIAVADGDHVETGQVLVELDPTKDVADRDKIARDLMQAELDIARLSAALAGDTAAFVPPAGADPALVDAARRQLAAQLLEIKMKIEGFDQQIAAKQAEREQAEANIAKIDDSLPLLQAKADIYHKIRQNQNVSEISVIESERQLSEEKHDRIVTTHQQEAAAAQIVSLTKQREEAEAQFRLQAFDDKRKATQYAAEQRQELIKAEERARLQVLRAPVAGSVEQLSVHTIGGVVQPAQTLMVIVPDDSKLEVEAMLPNRDAGFVHTGQPAELKIEAFNYTRYGLLHGQVRDVSRDALRDERDAPNPETGETTASHSKRNDQNSSPADAAYVARISLTETSVTTEQGQLPLEPGMTVSAEIKTGQRRVISYLLSPFMRYNHEALRER